MRKKYKDMKKLKNIVFLSIILVIASCNSKTSSPNSTKEANNESSIDKTDSLSLPYLSAPKEISFGIAKHNIPKEISLEVQNLGKKPLIIEKIDASCGCMKIQHTLRPILNGEKGFIKITINTEKQKGYFNKSIFVNSNAKNNLEIIRIKGEVN